MGKIAFLVDRMDEAAALSPFYAKAKWLLVLDVDSGVVTWMPNRRAEPNGLTAQLLASGAGALICGWVDDASRRALEGAGMVIHIRPCTCAALSLAETLAPMPPTAGDA